MPDPMNITSGTVRAHPDSRFAIIASRWNPRIVDALVDGAERALLEHGVAADAYQSADLACERLPMPST